MQDLTASEFITNLQEAAQQVQFLDAEFNAMIVDARKRLKIKTAEDVKALSTTVREKEVRNLLEVEQRLRAAWAHYRNLVVFDDGDSK